MKPMQPVRVLKNYGNDNGQPDGYGIIMSDGKNADIFYFDKFGLPQEKTIYYCRRVFKIYCEKKNLKQL